MCSVMVFMGNLLWFIRFFYDRVNHMTFTLLFVSLNGLKKCKMLQNWCHMLLVGQESVSLGNEIDMW